MLLFLNHRTTNEIKNLQYLPRTSEPREMLFEDRTRAHADHIGQGFERQTTAAVGVLKAVHCGEWCVPRGHCRGAGKAHTAPYCGSSFISSLYLYILIA